MNVERNYNIDLVRVFCAFAVFCFHARIHMGVNFSFLNSFIQQGAIFMSPFFMLSGFGLFMHYAKSNWMSNATLLKFYGKRFISIYPLYLTIHIIYILFFNKLSLFENVVLQPIELLALQSFFNGLSSVLHNGGTWFISCLFFCYLLFPMFERLIESIHTFRKFLIMGIITYVVIAISPMYEIVFKTSMIYINPFFRALEFLVGMLLARMAKDNMKLLKYGLCKVCCVLVLYVLIISELSKQQIFNNQYMRYNFITIPAFGVIIYCLSLCKNKFILKVSMSKAVSHLAQLAFAFYLGQFFCFKMAMNISVVLGVDKSSGVSFGIAFITCFVIAEAMHYIIENPCKIFLSNKMNAKINGTINE